MVIHLCTRVSLKLIYEKLTEIKINFVSTALRHHTLSQLRQLQDVEGFGKILMGLRNVRIYFGLKFSYFMNKLRFRTRTRKHRHRSHAFWQLTEPI